MDANEQRAILGIALAAAFADGARDEHERAEVRRIAEALQIGADFNMAALVQDVVLKRFDIAAEAAQLRSPELRQLAFEFAVGVCDAEGLRNDAETRFLADLGNALGLPQPRIVESAVAADAIVTAPLGQGTAAQAQGNEAELDKMILNAAITNGALELLPQTLATMAILGVQMRLVYRIGAAHGYELERAHLKEFLAAAGVSLTGQYLEQIGRGLVGGLFGSVAGKLVGALARGATGAAFSFATTYALGHLAKRYYAGGRVMDAQVLRDTYAALLAQARSLQANYRPQIEERVRTIDVTRLANLVRES